jgi:hypothetical protein
MLPTPATPFGILGNHNGERINILLVEDEQADTQRLVAGLEDARCFTIHHVDSYDDVNLAEEVRHCKADVVSLDLEINGEIHAQPVIYHLRQEDPTLVIGAITWHETFSCYLDGIDFFLVKDWSEMDRCVLTLKIGALRRVLSWLIAWLNKQIEFGATPSGFETGMRAEASRFVAKLAFLVNSGGWPFEMPKCDDFIMEMCRVQEQLDEKDFEDRLMGFLRSMEHLQTRMTRLGVRHDLLVVQPDGEDRITGLPAETEKRVSRYSDVLFPDECKLGQEVTLGIQLRIEGEMPTIEIPFGRERQIKLLVLVSGSGFDIPERAKSMLVPYDQDSDKVEFTVIPKHLGEQALSIEFFKKATRIGYIIATTFVGSGD